MEESKCKNHSAMEVRLDRGKEALDEHSQRIRMLESCNERLTILQEQGQKRLEFIESEIAERLDKHDARLTTLETCPGNAAKDMQDRIKFGFVGALVSALALYIARNIFGIM